MTVEARFTTTALAGPWVPVAYQPSSVDLPGARVLPGSDTVIIRRTDAINATYDVVSEDPAPTPAQLTGRAHRRRARRRPTSRCRTTSPTR